MKGTLEQTKRSDETADYTYCAKSRWPYRSPSLLEAGSLGIVSYLFTQMISQNMAPDSIQPASIDGLGIIVVMAVLFAVWLLFALLYSKLIDLVKKTFLANGFSLEKSRRVQPLRRRLL